MTSIVAAILPMNAEMCLARENGPHKNTRCDNHDGDGDDEQKKNTK